MNVGSLKWLASPERWHALRPRPARHRDPPPDLMWRLRPLRWWSPPGNTAAG